MSGTNTLLYVSLRNTKQDITSLFLKNVVSAMLVVFLA